MGQSSTYSEFLELDVKNLVHPGKLNQFNVIARQFGIIKTYISEMIFALDDSVTDDIKNVVNGYVNLWTSYFNQINSYDAAKDAQAQFATSKRIVQEVGAWYHSINNGLQRDISQGPSVYVPNHFLAISAFLKANQFKVKNIQGEVEAELALLKAHQNDAKKQHDEFVKFVDGVKAAIGDQAKEVGISKYGNLFLTEASRFQKLSERWFIGAIVVLIVTIVGTLLLWSLVNIDPQNTYDIVQFTVIKVLIVSGGFYALSVCMKNYRAHKHNEVLNKHRHNALTTFETFTTSTEDPQTKNSVLLAATQTIFGNQNTGYNNVETSDHDFTSKIIEYVRPTPDKL